MHSKKTLKNIILTYMLLLVPLYIYGIYKNGILLYQKDLISLGEIFKLLYLLIIGIVVYIIVTLVLRKKLKLNYNFLMFFLIPLFMPYHISYLLYSIIILIISILSYFIKFNYIALVLVIISLIGKYSYLNPGESLNIYSFNTLDLLWGRNIGGLGSSSIIYGLLLVVILSIFKDYKLIVVISAISIYVGLLIIFKDYAYLLNSNALNSIMIILPWMPNTPILKYSKVLYGLIGGGLVFFLTKYLDFYTGAFVGIFIVNFLYELICKVKKRVV